MYLLSKARGGLYKHLLCDWKVCTALVWAQGSVFLLFCSHLCVLMPAHSAFWEGSCQPPVMVANAMLSCNSDGFGLQC